MEVAAPDIKFTRLYDERGLPLSPEHDNRRPWLLSEIYFTRPRGYVSHRERGHLWNIARRHYFDVALQPISAVPQFIGGWSPAELTETDEYRWCGRRGVIGLQGVTGEAVLRLDFSIARELVPEQPKVRVLLNGKPIDTIAVSAESTVREWHVTPAPAGAPNTLELQIDKVYNSVARHTGEDPRDLGIRLHFLSFGPA